MKSILRILALFALLVFSCTCALADDVPVYWQLESIEVTTSASNSYGPVAAETDVVPFSGTDAREMIEAVRDVSSISLDVSRASTGSSAHADYTYSGVPALVPGAACASLTLTADTKAADAGIQELAHIFRLYTANSAHRNMAQRTADRLDIAKAKLAGREELDNIRAHIIRRDDFRRRQCAGHGNHTQFLGSADNSLVHIRRNHQARAGAMSRLNLFNRQRRAT